MSIPPKQGANGDPPAILHGARQIANFLFGNDPAGRRRVYHLTTELPEGDRLPIFKLGQTVCARRETLLAWVAQRERDRMEGER
jgi:hypothetical protein